MKQKPLSYDKDATCKSFFELLKGGLWESYTPQMQTGFSWNALFQLCQQQAVVGVTFKGVSKLPEQQRPPRPLFLQWTAMTAHIQETNRKMDVTLAALFAFFHAEHIQTVVIKGQGVARYYPEPSLRQSGDTDIYTAPENFATSRKLLKTLCNNERDDEKHCIYDTGQIHIENHRYVILLTSKHKRQVFDDILRRWFPRQIPYIDIENTKVGVPTTAFNTVYLLTHIFHHFINGGIGFRQISDWYLVLRKAAHDTSFDRNQFRKDLEDLELLKFAELLAAIAVHHFGFQEEDLPLEISSDANLEDILLQDILTGGNFGHNDHNRPEGNWSGRWYGYNSSIRRARRFTEIAPQALKHYSRYRVHIFLLNFFRHRLS